MGMAASQVRLLALTDRLHDVELKAQQILAQKLALGTQKDALYNNYCDALEATNYMVAFNNSAGGTSYNDANFANMCTFQEGRARNYAFVDQEGFVLTSADEAATYEMYNDDKFAFAWAMMGLTIGNEGGSLTEGSEQAVGLNVAATAGSNSTYLSGIRTDADTGDFSAFELELIEAYNTRMGDSNGIDLTAYNAAVAAYEAEPTDEKKAAISTEANNIRTSHAGDINKAMIPDGIQGNGNDVLMSASELLAFSRLSADDRNALQVYIDEVKNAKTGEDQQKAFEEFRDALYNSANGIKASDVYAEANNLSKFNRDYNEAEFQFYVQRWEAITEAGGCKEIDQRYVNGAEGREWLENMMKAGLIVVQEYNKNTHEWQDTSIATSTNGNHLMEVQDDTGLKAAEAKYEHELDIIDRKETKMDNELAKLETERKAITTELDSLKSVKDDNIDRTFGIFG